MKKSLKEFYASGPVLLDQLDRARDEIKGSSKPFNTSSLGSPLVLTDDIALILFENLLLYNTHFVPGKKPAIGMAVGDYTKHEGKDYIVVNLTALFHNAAYLHMARMYEEKLIAWDGIRKEVYENVAQFLHLAEIHFSDLLKELSLGEFHAACGLQYTDLPSSKFIANLRTFVERVGKESPSEELSNIVTEILGLCAPFVGLADDLYKLRGVLGNKGHFVFYDEHFGMSSPSFSGNASWFQHTSEDIAGAIPDAQNLDFLAVHSGKSEIFVTAFGSGSAPDRSITFLVPPSTLVKLQSSVDVNSELANKWEQYAYVPGECKEDIWKKVHGWQGLVRTALAEDAKEIIAEVVHGSILGLQLDMSNANGDALLRPVVCNAFMEKNRDSFCESGIAEIPKPAGFEEVLSVIDDSYYKIKSIFHSENEKAGA